MFIDGGSHALSKNIDLHIHVLGDTGDKKSISRCGSPEDYVI